MINTEHIWPQPRTLETGAEIPMPGAIRIYSENADLMPTGELMSDVSRIAGISFSLGDGESGGRAGYASSSVVRELGVMAAGDLAPEAYRLRMSADSAVVEASSRSGVSYAIVTLAQIIALSAAQADGKMPSLVIDDAPQYRKRCFMVDLGRSVFSIEFLQRIIRILAQLKMNQLHLHLYDDELCGLQIPGLPFGTENPHALSLDGLSALIDYASRYEVEIVPELEGWGHVGSIVYHRRELRGGLGMYSGSSFRIGPDSFDCMESIIEPVVSVMPDGGIIHLGLDEARWFVSDRAPSGYTPADMVAEYWKIVDRAAKKHGKTLDLRLWADHAGRPVPKEIEEHIIIEPWQYWIVQRAAIDRAIGRYGGEGKMRFMMGAGQSVAQYRGAYHATRYWARQAVGVPNAEGGNVTFWGANNLDENFVSLFVGSSYLWNPSPETSFASIEDYESFDRYVLPIMVQWQGMVRDARPDLIRADRGEMVRLGYYVWGPDHGKPVAPSVTANEHATDHDYVNEVS